MYLFESEKISFTVGFDVIFIKFSDETSSDLFMNTLNNHKYVINIHRNVVVFTICHCLYSWKFLCSIVVLVDDWYCVQTLIGSLLKRFFHWEMDWLMGDFYEFYVY